MSDAQLKYGIKIPIEQLESLSENLNTGGDYDKIMNNNFYDFIIEYNDLPQKASNLEDSISLYMSMASDYFLIVSKKAPSYMAELTEVVLVGNNELKVDESWKKDIVQFCEKFNVEYQLGQIGWYLTCDTD
jgi:hypothetical protein